MKEGRSQVSGRPTNIFQLQLLNNAHSLSEEAHTAVDICYLVLSIKRPIVNCKTSYWTVFPLRAAEGPDRTSRWFQWRWKSLKESHMTPKGLQHRAAPSAFYWKCNVLIIQVSNHLFLPIIPCVLRKPSLTKHKPSSTSCLHPSVKVDRCDVWTHQLEEIQNTF